MRPWLVATRRYPLTVGWCAAIAVAALVTRIAEVVR